VHRAYKEIMVRTVHRVLTAIRSCTQYSCKWKPGANTVLY